MVNSSCKTLQFLVFVVFKEFLYLHISALFRVFGCIPHVDYNKKFYQIMFHPNIKSEEYNCTLPIFLSLIDYFVGRLSTSNYLFITLVNVIVESTTAVI